MSIAKRWLLREPSQVSQLSQSQASEITQERTEGEALFEESSQRIATAKAAKAKPAVLSAEQPNGAEDDPALPSREDLELELRAITEALLGEGRHPAQIARELRLSFQTVTRLLNRRLAFVTTPPPTEPCAACGDTVFWCRLDGTPGGAVGRARPVTREARTW